MKRTSSLGSKKGAAGGPEVRPDNPIPAKAIPKGLSEHPLIACHSQYYSRNPLLLTGMADPDFGLGSVRSTRSVGFHHQGGHHTAAKDFRFLNLDHFVARYSTASQQSVSGSVRSSSTSKKQHHAGHHNQYHYLPLIPDLTEELSSLNFYCGADLDPIEVVEKAKSHNSVDSENCSAESTNGTLRSSESFESSAKSSSGSFSSGSETSGSGGGQSKVIPPPVPKRSKSPLKYSIAPAGNSSTSYHRLHRFTGGGGHTKQAAPDVPTLNRSHATQNNG